LVEESDLVLATSDHLAVPLTALGADVVVTSNGVDFDAFRGSDGAAAPLRLRALPRPRIGLLGNLNNRIDWQLLEQVAERRPDWQLVLIGPLYMADEESAASAQRLTERDNVHSLGAVSESAMASCMKCFDVGLIPYRLNRVTRSINPLKVYQYLACGLPVVATALPSLRGFGEVISVAADGDEVAESFVAAIARELEEGSSDERERRMKKRIQWAAQFDWAAIADRQLELFRDRLP
jgi:glycosyltransferase involved in cell wall biosynthesis